METRLSFDRFFSTVESGRGKFEFNPTRKFLGNGDNKHVATVVTVTAPKMHTGGGGG